MRVDLFIHLLDAKKRTVKASSAKAYEVSYSSAQSSEDSERNRQGYSVDLSYEALKKSKKLAYKIRDQNQGQISLTSSSLAQLPSSLSVEVDQPSVKFNELIEAISMDPQRLVQAHGELDRAASLKLLLE